MSMETAAIQRINDWYAKSALTGEWAEYEPAWKPNAFHPETLAAKDAEEVAWFANQFGTLDLNYMDHFFGRRPLQDGLKIGTSTWTFMGRADAVKANMIMVSTNLKTGVVLCANGRRAPNHQWFWCLWQPNDDGFTLHDRNPTTDAHVIRQILASHGQFGISGRPLVEPQQKMPLPKPPQRPQKADGIVEGGTRINRMREILDPD